MKKLMLILGCLLAVLSASAQDKNTIVISEVERDTLDALVSVEVIHIEQTVDTLDVQRYTYEQVRTERIDLRAEILFLRRQVNSIKLDAVNNHTDYTANGRRIPIINRILSQFRNEIRQRTKQKKFYDDLWELLKAIK